MGRVWAKLGSVERLHLEGWVGQFDLPVLAESGQDLDGQVVANVTPAAHGRQVAERQLDPMVGKAQVYIRREHLVVDEMLAGQVAQLVFSLCSDRFDIGFGGTPARCRARPSSRSER